MGVSLLILPLSAARTGDEADEVSLAPKA